MPKSCVCGIEEFLVAWLGGAFFFSFFGLAGGSFFFFSFFAWLGGFCLFLFWSSWEAFFGLASRLFSFSFLAWLGGFLPGWEGF